MSNNDEICTAAGQINSLGVRLSELSLHLSQIEMKLNELENRSNLTQQVPVSETKSAIQQVNNISRQLEIIMECLRSTPDYNIGKIFHCNSCGTMGTVAIRVKCTTCNHESWWGWWPQNKKIT